MSKKAWEHVQLTTLDVEGTCDILQRDYSGGLVFRMDRDDNPKGRKKMGDSVYRIIEMVGTSEKSWEEAAKNAIELAGKSVRDIRIAEVETLDMKVEKNKVVAYRARVKASFKYQE